MSLTDDLLSSPIVLTEGAVLERIRRDGRVPLHPILEHAGFVKDPSGRSCLEIIYREYIDIGQKYNLPMLVGTPTWRANRDRTSAAGVSCQQLNMECARFLINIRETYGVYGSRILISGLTGCKGDSYGADESLSREQARTFHAEQVEALAASGVDLLFAATLPAVDEAEGIAMAMEATGLPYVISFVTGGDGSVLDGTPLQDAILAIDGCVGRKPIGFMVNCVHPSPFRKTFQKTMIHSPGAASRVFGLQANTSPRSPSELDGLPYLETEDPSVLADSMIRLHEDFGLKVLGGCCGTDGRHITQLALRMAKLSHEANDGRLFV